MLKLGGAPFGADNSPRFVLESPLGWLQGPKHLVKIDCIEAVEVAVRSGLAGGHRRWSRMGAMATLLGSTVIKITRSRDC